MICTITENARVLMINSLIPILFWGEAVNTTVYLHQRSPNKGLKSNDNNSYKALYEMPYKMLYGFGKTKHHREK